MKNWIYLLLASLPFLAEGANNYANTPPPPPPPKHRSCDFEPTEINGRGVFHANGEFLYWRVFNNGMPYAVSAHPPTISPTAPINEKIEHVSFDYHSGFRVGAGYTTPYDEWDISGSWVSYSSSENAFASADGVNSMLFPLWSFLLDRATGFDFTQPVNAGAEMRIDFDVVDISLGRFFFIGSTFAFKPSMGVKLAWIKQREDITYTGALAGLNAFTEDTVNLLNRMRGTGLRLGSDLRMILKWGFEFYGSVFYSLLSSNIQVNDEEFLNIQGFAPADDIAKNRLRLMNTAIEMSAGLKWGTYVYKKAYLSVHVGFEQQNYMDFNQLRLLIVALTPRGISSNGNSGSFGMHGLVTGAKLFF